MQPQTFFRDQGAKKSRCRTRDRASISLLTMYRGAGGGEPGANPPPKRDAPQPSPIGVRGGALREASAQPPADAVWVAPGQSIQAALDTTRGKGGWVVMSKGVATLSAPLRLPSGMILAGEGTGTVLWMDAKATGPAIVNATEDLHDVVLRDFVLEGATTSSLPRDPNAARRTRSRPTAPRRGGIRFIGQSGKALANLRLEHVTVRNCTEAGLALENARQVVLAGCSFTDNAQAGQVRVESSRSPESPYLDPAQLDCPWPKMSHYKQPWRGYLETRSGYDFLNGLGVNLHIPAETEELAIRLLAETGFRTFRIEIGWGEFPCSIQVLH